MEQRKRVEGRRRETWVASGDTWRRRWECSWGNLSTDKIVCVLGRQHLQKEQRFPVALRTRVPNLHGAGMRRPREETAQVPVCGPGPLRPAPPGAVRLGPRSCLRSPLSSLGLLIRACSRRTTSWLALSQGGRAWGGAWGGAERPGKGHCASCLLLPSFPLAFQSDGHQSSLQASLGELGGPAALTQCSRQCCWMSP